MELANYSIILKQCTVVIIKCQFPQYKLLCQLIALEVLRFHNTVTIHYLNLIKYSLQFTLSLNWCKVSGWIRAYIGELIIIKIGMVTPKFQYRRTSYTLHDFVLLILTFMILFISDI